MILLGRVETYSETRRMKQDLLDSQRLTNLSFLSCDSFRFAFSFRYFTENTVDPISVVSGLVQTGLYMDFFYSEFFLLSFFLYSDSGFLSSHLSQITIKPDLTYPLFLLSLLNSLLHESHARRKVRTSSLKEIIFQGMKKSEA